MSNVRMSFTGRMAVGREEPCEALVFPPVKCGKGPAAVRMKRSHPSRQVPFLATGPGRLVSENPSWSFLSKLLS